MKTFKLQMKAPFIARSALACDGFMPWFHAHGYVIVAETAADARAIASCLNSEGVSHVETKQRWWLQEYMSDVFEVDASQQVVAQYSTWQ